jgi:hypothetical protein
MKPHLIHGNYARIIIITDVENEKYPKIMDDAEPPDENCL